MAVLFEKTKLLTDKQFHYCPGCNHGIIHRLVAEVIDEMNLDGKVIGVAPVGCSVFAYDYFNCDMYEVTNPEICNHKYTWQRISQSAVLCNCLPLHSFSPNRAFPVRWTHEKRLQR